MPWWQADYVTDDGARYTIDGFGSNECPVSYITPKSRYLVEFYLHAKTLGGLQAIFPPGQSPTWAVDTFLTLEHEAKREQHSHARALGLVKDDA